jgi:hypothetical protein
MPSDKFALPLVMTLVLAACSNEAGESQADASADVIEVDAMALTCAPAVSTCDPADPRSVVRGFARLPAESTPGEGTSGDLVVALYHRRYGDTTRGGNPHWITRIPDVDLGQGPVPFQIDMCSGNAMMWSEENCEYNLIVVLDSNGNNSIATANMVPDVDEPAAMAVVELSCRGESPCLDLTLDCRSGQACVTYDPPGECACAAESCASESSICAL